MSDMFLHSFLKVQAPLINMIYGDPDGLSDKFGDSGNKLSLKLYKS